MYEYMCVYIHMLVYIYMIYASLSLYIYIHRSARRHQKLTISDDMPRNSKSRLIDYSID